MVDNIKFILEDFSPSEEFTVGWDKLKKEYPNKYLYTTLLYNRQYKVQKHPLKLLLTADKKTEKFSLSISGSIRKWYYQKNSRKDLKQEEFEGCIRLLSKELCIDEKVLLKGKVTKLELGLTILLKSKFKGIIDCFVKYRNAKRDNKFKTTLYFEFKNYKLVFYEKFSEMNKGKILNKGQEKFSKKFDLLRFEISLKKISGTVYKNKFNTIGKIIDQWEIILKIMEKYISNIVFVDVLSKEKEMESKINDYSSIRDFIFFLGIKSYGLHKFIALFDKVIKTNNKSKYLNIFLDTYRRHITDDTDLKAELMTEVRKKSSKLYNKIK